MPLSASPSTPQATFTQLYEAFADGRLTNIYYRRQQLARLHEALIRSRKAVLDGIVQDERGTTSAEAFVELYLTLATIKLYHDGLQPKQQLDMEYSIAYGRDAPVARRGVGIVAIIPHAHSFLYSVLVPLAAALSAGNCVVVVREQTLQSLPSVLKSILQEALETDIYMLVDGKAIADLAGDGFILVDQIGHESPTKYQILSSPSEALSIAIVDRTADIDAAARTLVDARMRFAGRSPHAPDVVLVNEFAKADFLQKVVQHAIRYMTELNGTVNSTGNDSLDGGVAKRQARQVAGIKIVTAGSNVSISDVIERNALPSVGKVHSAALYVHAIRSLDDAIEVANSLAQGSAAAAFAFGDLKTCKYLLEFIDSDVGFSNRFPTELLVGPVAPRGHQSSSLWTRYPVELFSFLRPQFVQETALSRQVDRLLVDNSNVAHAKAQESLLQELELEPRAPVRNIEGYFETAAAVGLVTVAVPVFLSLGTLIFFGVRAGLAK